MLVRHILDVLWMLGWGPRGAKEAWREWQEEQKVYDPGVMSPVVFLLYFLSLGELFCCSTNIWWLNPKSYGMHTTSGWLSLLNVPLTTHIPCVLKWACFPPLSLIFWLLCLCCWCCHPFRPGAIRSPVLFKFPDCNNPKVANFSYYLVL